MVLKMFETIYNSIYTTSDMKGLNVLENLDNTNGFKYDSKYFRKEALKTFTLFMVAEVIGFGLAVPIATIFGVLYGKIVDIFFDVYFKILVFVTIGVVVFLAYPTNMILMKDFIKLIISPSDRLLYKTTNNLSNISFWASFWLFVRITLGGIIVIFLPVILGEPMALRGFDTLRLILPVAYASFSGAILYFFTLQRLFAKFNYNFNDVASFLDYSSLKRLSFLDSKNLFAYLISINFSFSAIVIIFGKFFEVTFFSFVIIILISLFTIGIILYQFRYVLLDTIKGIYLSISEIKNITINEVVSSQRFTIAQMYDIEKISILIKRYFYESSNEISDSIKTYIELESEFERLVALSKEVYEMKEKLKNFVGSINVSSEENWFNDTVSYYKRYSVLGTISGEFSLVVRRALEFFDEFGNDMKRISYVFEDLEYAMRIPDIINQEVRILKKNTENLEIVHKKILNLKDYLIQKSEIIINFAKDMELVSINSQVEIVKFNYGDEFYVISREILKLLDKAKEWSKNINDLSIGLSEVMGSFVKSVKDVIISVESYTQVMDDVYTVSQNSHNIMKTLSDKLDFWVKENTKAISILDNLSSLLGDLNKILSNINSIVDSFNRKISEEKSILAQLNLKNSEAMKYFDTYYDTLEEGKKLITNVRKKLNRYFV